MISSVKDVKKFINKQIGDDKDVRHLVKKSSTTFGFRIIGIGLIYALTVIVSRFFGAAAVGIYAISQNMINVTSVAGRLGFDTAAIKLLAPNFEKGRWGTLQRIYSNIMKIVVPWNIVLTIALFFSTKPLAVYFFHKPYLDPYLKIAVLAQFPFVLRMINSGCLQGIRRIREFAYSQNVSYYLYAAIILLVASLFSRNSYLPNLTFLVGLSLTGFSSCVYLLLLFRKKAKENQQAEPIGEEYKPAAMLKLSTPMMFTSSIVFLSSMLNIFLLGRYSSNAETGIYYVVFRLASISTFFLLAITNVAAPRFAHFYAEGDMKSLAKTAYNSSKLNFYVSGLIMLAIILLRKFILSINGHDFSQSTASEALLIVMVGQAVNTFTGATGYFLNMTGGHKAFLLIIFISFIINVICGLILIPRYGIIGASITSGVYMTCWNLGAVFYIYRKYKINMCYLPFLTPDPSKS
jgi:O-antigen/teichoic acid export membrane protein